MKKLSELSIADLLALRTYWVGQKSEAWESVSTQKSIDNNYTKLTDVELYRKSLNIHYDK